MDNYEVKTHYSVQAGPLLDEADYPKVEDDSVQFPKEIYVAFAVCRKRCGRMEFIVDGSTQICHYCGMPMFRIRSEKYVVEESPKT